jgi:hypothetical protein
MCLDLNSFLGYGKIFRNCPTSSPKQELKNYVMEKLIFLPNNTCSEHTVFIVHSGIINLLQWTYS